MGFARLMASPIGRLARIVAGLALIAVGFFVQGAWGVVIGVVGAIPLLAGVFNVCLVAPLLRVPFSGARLRAQS
jgi:hypothetical protein